MSSIGLFVLLFILSFPSAFAATEPSSSESRSACEAELVQDSFYRLVNKALEDRLVTAAELDLLAASTTPFNPLARLVKTNPALLKAFDVQVNVMTPERWAQLRVALQALASSSSGENSARAESRAKTANILRPVVVEQTDFIRGTIYKMEWQNRADGSLALDVSMYGMLTPIHRELKDTGIHLNITSLDSYDFVYNGEKLQFFTGDGALFVANLAGEERAKVIEPGLISRSVRLYSRRDQAYVFVLTQNSRWRVYRFDGSSLKMETSFVGDELIELNPFITQRNELYFVDQDGFWYRDPQTGHYEKIPGRTAGMRSHFWDEDLDDQATLIIQNSTGDLVAIDFRENSSAVRRIPVSVGGFHWDMAKFVGPDGKSYFVLAELGKAIRIFDAKDWRVLVSIPGSHDSASLAVEVLPDGRVLMSTVQNVKNPRVLKIYRLWNAVEKGSP